MFLCNKKVIIPTLKVGKLRIMYVKYLAHNKCSIKASYDYSSVYGLRFIIYYENYIYKKLENKNCLKYDFFKIRHYVVIKIMS